MGEFTMKVEMGNAAMQDGYDLAGVLRKVANEVELGLAGMPVLDLNGNRVGRWELTDG